MGKRPAHLGCLGEPSFVFILPPSYYGLDRLKGLLAFVRLSIIAMFP